MRRYGPISLILLTILASGIAGGSSADASANVTATLLSEHASIEPGRPFTVGLRMKMRRGWHTYWKNPGDSGLPLRITWNLPDGFTAGPIEWPAPERIPGNSLMSYGYAGDVLLPIEITPPESLGVESVTVAGTFEWLECADVCLPGSAVLNLSLPVRRAPPSPGPSARAFAVARGRLPRPATDWSLAAEAGPRAISLTFRDPHGADHRAGYLFVDQPLVVDYAAPQGFDRVAGGYRLTVPPAANAQGPPERLTGVLVLDGRGGSRSGAAIRVDVPVTSGDPDPAPVPPADTDAPMLQRWIVGGLAGLGFAILLVRLRRSGGNRSKPPREPIA